MTAVLFELHVGICLHLTSEPSYLTVPSSVGEEVNRKSKLEYRYFDFTEHSYVLGICVLTRTEFFLSRYLEIHNCYVPSCNMHCMVLFSHCNRNRSTECMARLLCVDLFSDEACLVRHNDINLPVMFN